MEVRRSLVVNATPMEMRIALQEWLKRIPDFELDQERPMTWSEGAVRGPRLLPILIAST